MHHSAIRLEPGQISYSPALGTVASFLLVHSPLEEAFWNLVSIANRYARDYWTEKGGLNGFKLATAAFDEILNELDPFLARHLVRPLLSSAVLDC